MYPKAGGECITLRRSPYLPQMQLTNPWLGASHLPLDVSKSRWRVPNLTQVTIPSSDATHQPYALVLLTFYKMYPKAGGECLTLRRSPYLPQMQLTNPWLGASHLQLDVSKSRWRVPNLTQVTIPSSDATHQSIVLLTFHWM